MDAGFFFLWYATPSFYVERWTLNVEISTPIALSAGGAIYHAAGPSRIYSAPLRRTSTWSKQAILPLNASPVFIRVFVDIIAAQRSALSTWIAGLTVILAPFLISAWCNVL
jgi:hypothetical protein